MRHRGPVSHSATAAAECQIVTLKRYFNQTGRIARNYKNLYNCLAIVPGKHLKGPRCKNSDYERGGTRRCLKAFKCIQFCKHIYRSREGATGLLVICNFEVYETKFCQYEYWAPELEAALKSGNRLPSNAAES